MNSFDKIKAAWEQETGKKVRAKTDWCMTRILNGETCKTCPEQPNCHEFNNYMLEFMTSRSANADNGGERKDQTND